MSPEVGSSKATKRSRVVLFPLPVAPMMPYATPLGDDEIEFIKDQRSRWLISKGHVAKFECALEL